MNKIKDLYGKLYDELECCFKEGKKSEDKELSTFVPMKGFRYDSDLTRSVYEFINKHDNRPICCAGYVSFLHELLERLVYSDGKLNLAHWSVNSKSETNATVDYDNHDRSLAYLEDLKYKLNAIFMSDPTWDSNKFFATRSPDFRRTVVRHLLKTRDELSTEKSDFSDPLRNMHIESDDDINRIRIDLGLDDSISNDMLYVQSIVLLKKVLLWQNLIQLVKMDIL